MGMVCYLHSFYVQPRRCDLLTPQEGLELKLKILDIYVRRDISGPDGNERVPGPKSDPNIHSDRGRLKSR